METVDDEILDLSIKFMDKAKAASKPFFLWLNPTRMHVVTHLSPKYEALRNSKNGWTIQEAGMAQLDDIVGSVMKYLKDNGLDDDTMVMFTTDNGTEAFTWPDGGTTPFYGAKGTGYEGGFRVPAMIRWPGHVPAGKVESGVISGLDWFPTFVAAAGNPNIKDDLLKGVKLGDRTYKNHLDSYNQLDLITGKGPSARREIYYFAENNLAAVRIDDYKYQFITQPGGWIGTKDHPDVPILTNLRLDPFERMGFPGRTEIGIATLFELVHVRVLALRVRPTGSWETRHERHRVSAHAEGRILQPRRRKGEDRSGDGETRTVATVSKPPTPSRLRRVRNLWPFFFIYQSSGWRPRYTDEQRTLADQSKS